MTTPYHAAPCASRYQVVGPVLRGKDLVVATIARVETGDEEQDRELAERIAAALNFCDGMATVTLVESRQGRAT
ncbi:MAG TPA: hypothetical protein DCQ64_25375 [Candidatus Rokubacteria bacterium]|nr:hypothetical protein [Candidatus Rokubacteria bacterium]